MNGYNSKSQEPIGSNGPEIHPFDIWPDGLYYTSHPEPPSDDDQDPEIISVHEDSPPNKPNEPLEPIPPSKYQNNEEQALNLALEISLLSAPVNLENPVDPGLIADAQYQSADDKKEEDSISQDSENIVKKGSNFNTEQFDHENSELNESLDYDY